MSGLKLHMLQPKLWVLQPSLHVLRKNLASEEAKIGLSKSTLVRLIDSFIHLKDRNLNNMCICIVVKLPKPRENQVHYLLVMISTNFHLSM